MGVCGYLTPRVIELRMTGGPDGCGIRWEGAVVEGRAGLARKLELERLRAIAEPRALAGALEGMERDLRTAGSPAGR
jgi:hypothetical protein